MTTAKLKEIKALIVRTDVYLTTMQLMTKRVATEVKPLAVSAQTISNARVSIGKPNIDGNVLIQGGMVKLTLLKSIVQIPIGESSSFGSTLNRLEKREKANDLQLRKELKFYSEMKLARQELLRDIQRMDFSELVMAVPRIARSTPASASVHVNNVPIHIYHVSED